MPNFCYECGICIGYSARECSKRPIEVNGRRFEQYGEWLRASFLKKSQQHYDAGVNMKEGRGGRGRHSDGGQGGRGEWDVSGDWREDGGSWRNSEGQNSDLRRNTAGARSPEAETPVYGAPDQAKIKVSSLLQNPINPDDCGREEERLPKETALNTEICTERWK